MTPALFSESRSKFGTWTGHVYEWWEQHHIGQANKNTFLDQLTQLYDTQTSFAYDQQVHVSAS